MVVQFVYSWETSQCAVMTSLITELLFRSGSAMASRIPRLRGVTLLVRDTADSLKYYKDAMGLRLSPTSSNVLTSGLGLCDLRLRRAVGGDEPVGVAAAPRSRFAVICVPITHTYYSHTCCIHIITTAPCRGHHHWHRSCRRLSLMLSNSQVRLRSPSPSSPWRCPIYPRVYGKSNGAAVVCCP